jgi:phage tail-like protein
MNVPLARSEQTMTTPRRAPYGHFNFVVTLGSGAEAGFQEVSGLAMETTAAEYRAGAGPEKSVTKVSGINKASEVTLKRGVVSASALEEWTRDLREGDPRARNVTIRLTNQNGSPAASWKVIGARIIKHTSGPLNARGTDVAMEELVLGYERLEVDEE